MDINRDTDPAAERPVFIYGADDQPVDLHRHSRRISVRLPDGYPLGTLHRQRFRGFPSRLAANTKVQFGDTATYFRNWGFVGYASDDWHMFPKFTVTYGVRYEAFTPPTEINGHIANLAVSPDFSTVQCVTPVATGNCVAGIFGFAYSTAITIIGRRGLASPGSLPGNGFRDQHQMTVRAGYSMFYVESYLNTLSSEMANQPPFATANTLTTQTVATPPLSFQTNLSTALPSYAHQHRRRESELSGSLCDDLESVDRIQSGAQHIHGSDVHGNAGRASGRASRLRPHEPRPRTPRASPMTRRAHSPISMPCNCACKSA